MIVPCVEPSHSLFHLLISALDWDAKEGRKNDLYVIEVTAADSKGAIQ